MLFNAFHIITPFIHFNVFHQCIWWMVSHILEPSIADPLFPFWPVWWNSATLPLNNHAQYPQTSWWLVGTLWKTGYSCLWGIDITLWLALLNAINLAFLETFINFTLVQIINSWYLLYGNDETLTQNLLIPRQEPNCWLYRCATLKLLFSPWNQRFLSLRLFIKMIHI